MNASPSKARRPATNAMLRAAIAYAALRGLLWTLDAVGAAVETHWTAASHLLGNASLAYLLGAVAWDYLRSRGASFFRSPKATTNPKENHS